jgi:hypothetical protein
MYFGEIYCCRLQGRSVKQAGRRFPSSAGYLFYAYFDPEDGGDMCHENAFLQTIRRYPCLQPPHISVVAYSFPGWGDTESAGHVGNLLACCTDP